MVCIDCGRQTASFSRRCDNCHGSRFQNTDSLDGFWSRFSTKPRHSARHQARNAEAHASEGFFSGFWPLKLLFLPLWLGWKLLAAALRILF